MFSVCWAAAAGDAVTKPRQRQDLKPTKTRVYAIKLRANIWSSGRESECKCEWSLACSINLLSHLCSARISELIWSRGWMHIEDQTMLHRHAIALRPSLSMWMKATKMKMIYEPMLIVWNIFVGITYYRLCIYAYYCNGYFHRTYVYELWIYEA